ncbi:MAG: PP2C family protein-serine/threonine phosphatase [Acidimicrobiales bacterium]
MDRRSPRRAGCAHGRCAPRRPLFHGSREELLAAYPNLQASVETAGIHAFANLPLVIEQRIIGAISMSWPAERTFTDDDRSFMISIAAMCAQAVDRTLLSERQARVVETLQRAILPESLPSVRGAELCARYLPATRGILVGGDWYDAFVLPDGRLALSIGDVSGHGVPAASVMAQLRNSMRAYTFDGDSPDAVLTKLDVLVSAADHGLLVTTVIAMYDPATGEVVWASAGHPPILTHDGVRTAFAEEPGAPLLGTSPAYRTGSLRLDEGSLLLLYTDGLVEHRTTTVQRGLDALEAEVQAAQHKPLDELCDHVIVATRGTQTQEDDLCVLALRRTATRGSRRSVAPVARRDERTAIPSR